MFDLENSIREWRAQMLAAGIKFPVPLEELEIHLREEIEQQMNLGLDTRCAFEIAVEKIGAGKSLKNEFQKASLFTLKLYERIALVIGGIAIAVSSLIVLLLPVVHPKDWEKSPEVIPMLAPAILLFVVLVVVGVILAICGGKKVSWLPKKRVKYV